MLLSIVPAVVLFVLLTSHGFGGLAIKKLFQRETKIITKSLYDASVVCNPSQRSDTESELPKKQSQVTFGESDEFTASKTG